MHEALNIIIGIPCTIFVIWVLVAIFMPAHVAYQEIDARNHRKRERQAKQEQKKAQEPLPDNVVQFKRKAS